MCKQISTEYVLGSVLYYKPTGVTLSYLRNFEKAVYNSNSDLILDFSKSALISVLDSCDQYFKFENDLLLLENYYLDNMDRIKSRFVDVLDASFRDIITSIVIDD